MTAVVEQVLRVHVEAVDLHEMKPLKLDFRNLQRNYPRTWKSQQDFQNGKLIWLRSDFIN